MQSKKIRTRQWNIPVSAHCERFSTATWNVLAQCYIGHKSDFPLTDRRLLKWKARSKAILEHIRRIIPTESPDTCSLPDLLCLQEVDNFDSFFHSELKKMGFGGVCYKPRTHQRKVKQDGSLISFQRNRFELVETKHLEFNISAHTVPNNNRGDDDDYWERDCVAAVCVLRDIAFGGLFVVASAHLYWDPQCTDVKLLQAVTLLKHVNDVASSLDDVRGVIVCGDLNVLPNSAVMRLLTEGFLDRQHADCYNVTPQVADHIDQMLLECSVVSSLSSAYSLQHSHISTLTPKFNGLLDYILYKEVCETSNLKPCTPLAATLRLPCEKEFHDAGVRALPSDECPSDHLSIAALFHFNNNCH